MVQLILLLLSPLNHTHLHTLTLMMEWWMECAIVRTELVSHFISFCLWMQINDLCHSFLYFVPSFLLSFFLFFMFCFVFLSLFLSFFFLWGIVSVLVSLVQKFPMLFVYLLMFSKHWKMLHNKINSMSQLFSNNTTHRQYDSHHLHHLYPPRILTSVTAMWFPPVIVLMPFITVHLSTWPLHMH